MFIVIAPPSVNKRLLPLEISTLAVAATRVMPHMTAAGVVELTSHPQALAFNDCPAMGSTPATSGFGDSFVATAAMTPPGYPVGRGKPRV